MLTLEKYGRARYPDLNLKNGGLGCIMPAIEIDGGPLTTVVGAVFLESAVFFRWLFKR